MKPLYSQKFIWQNSFLLGIRESTSMQSLKNLRFFELVKNSPNKVRFAKINIFFVIIGMPIFQLNKISRFLVILCPNYCYRSTVKKSDLKFRQYYRFSWWQEILSWFNNLGTFGLLMEICPCYMSLKYLQNSFKAIYN